MLFLKQDMYISMAAFYIGNSFFFKTKPFIGRFRLNSITSSTDCIVMAMAFVCRDKQKKK